MRGKIYEGRRKEEEKLRGINKVDGGGEEKYMKEEGKKRKN